MNFTGVVSIGYHVGFFFTLFQRIDLSLSLGDRGELGIVLSQTSQKELATISGPTENHAIRGHIKRANFQLLFIMNLDYDLCPKHQFSLLHCTTIRSLLEHKPVCSLCDLWVLGIASELATWNVYIYQKVVLSYPTQKKPLASHTDL